MFPSKVCFVILNAFLNLSIYQFKLLVALPRTVWIEDDLNIVQCWL